MKDHRITRALTALVVAGALVSCAADAEPPASGKREGKGKAAQEKRADRKHGHHSAAKPAQAKKRGNQRGSAAAGAAANSGTGSTGAAQGNAAAAQPLSRPSCHDDSSGDLDSSGSAPTYADVTRGCLRTDGSQLRLEASTVGPVPSRMPDRNTQLSYGFEVTPPSGSTLYVHAQASPGGWTTYVSHGNGQRAIDRPTIDGDRIVLTLPLAELRGAQRVQWALESSWLRSGLLGTSYAFDSAPNIGTASFHRRPADQSRRVLQHHGQPLTDTDADGGHAPAVARLAQPGGEGAEDPAAGGPERVPDRDRAALGVDDLGVDASRRRRRPATAPRTPRSARPRRRRPRRCRPGRAPVRRPRPGRTRSRCGSSAWVPRPGDPREGVEADASAAARSRAARRRRRRSAARRCRR